MRKTLLASAAALGVALALPAFAQDTTAAPPAAAAEQPGPLATALPVPDIGSDATPEKYLQAAQQEVQRHRGAAAQEALERAETRLLDRSTAPGDADHPDTTPAVQAIAQAIDAVGKRDWQAAGQQIDTALKHSQMAESGGGMAMPQGQTPAAGMMGGTGAAIGTDNGAAMPGGAPAGTPPSGAPMMAPNNGTMAPNNGMMAPNTPQ